MFFLIQRYKKRSEKYVVKHILSINLNFRYKKISNGESVRDFRLKQSNGYSLFCK